MGGNKKSILFFFNTFVTHFVNLFIRDHKFFLNVWHLHFVLRNKNKNGTHITFGQ